MRHARFTVIASGLLMAGVAGKTAGCRALASDDGKEDLQKSLCRDFVTCGEDGNSVGPAPVACTGDPTLDSTLLTSECAVFVSADAQAPGNGSEDSPFQSLQQAIEVASDTTNGKKLKWVIACASQQDFKDPVTVSKTVSIYGGFDCANGWTWSKDGRTTLTAGQDTIPLTVKGKDVLITNFSVEGADATIAGGSSIAVLVDNADPSFLACDFKAGNGFKGTDGESAPSQQAAGGKQGNPGTDACKGEIDVSAGAAQVQTACGMVKSTGGTGGDSSTDHGDPGIPGLPNNGGGKAGLGYDPMSAGWSCNTVGKGGDGAPGPDGNPGEGAKDLGTLSAGGFVGAPGGGGSPGTPGQGGGGGGGNRAGNQCALGGASGGSGGSGGCGGAGGKGGSGGGSSIALVSINSPGLSLTEVTLTAGIGGDGGNGGDYQIGGPIGPGGPGGKSANGVPSFNGCAGGNGGDGGAGGSGGGGRGGHSIGLAFTGTMPSVDLSKTQVSLGGKGKGGLGGNANMQGNNGQDGVEGMLQDFTAAGQ